MIKNYTLNYANAEGDCNTRGGSLASIHSRAESDFIRSLGVTNMRLGASDLASEVPTYNIWIVMLTKMSNYDGKKFVGTELSYDYYNEVSKGCNSGIIQPIST